MDWAPSITTTSLFAAALWLSRNMIAERLKNSVKHEFDVKLEKVRAEIRASEGHLNAVRSTALAALASGQTALNERRLRAIEDVWGVTMVLKSGTSLVNVIGLLNLDNVAKHLRDGDPATQQFVRFIQTFGEGFGDRLKKSKDASSARPFLSPMAWAFYTAYSSIVTLAFVQMEALKAGGEPLPFVKTKETIELVKTALPEFAQLLDEHGTAALREVLPDIEERLLAELRASAGGRDSDKEGAQRAMRVGELLARQEAERVKEAKEKAGL